MKRWLALALFIVSAAVAEKPVFLATIKPYGLLLSQLVGEVGEVAVLVPPSANPHVYEPTPSQVRLVGQARLVVAGGAHLDVWVVDKLIRPNTLATPVLWVADAVKEELISTPTGPDPHVWVDPLLMAKAVPALVAALERVDPAHGVLYRTRGDRLQAELLKLDREVRALLGERTKPGVLALRNPVRYFARWYSIPVLYTVVPNPEAPEASARAVAEARRIAQEKQIRYLLAPLATRTQALPLGRNLGLEVIFLDILGEEATSYPELVRQIATGFAQALR